jgi:hypothetical protein
MRMDGQLYTFVQFVHAGDANAVFKFTITDMVIQHKSFRPQFATRAHRESLSRLPPSLVR